MDANSYRCSECIEYHMDNGLGYPECDECDEEIFDEMDDLGQE